VVAAALGISVRTAQRYNAAIRNATGG